MPLRVAIPDMVSPSYFPAIAAVELGFFKKEGLDAAIELVFPVTKTFEELREGRLDFAGGAAHAPLYAFRDWTGCKLICALSQNMYWFLVVRKDIGAKRGELRALKGLRIGAAPGPADGLKRMLVESGIDPEREVNIAPVPGAAAAGETAWEPKRRYGAESARSSSTRGAATGRRARSTTPLRRSSRLRSRSTSGPKKSRRRCAPSSGRRAR